MWSHQPSICLKTFTKSTFKAFFEKWETPERSILPHERALHIKTCFYSLSTNDGVVTFLINLLTSQNLVKQKVQFVFFVWAKKRNYRLLFLLFPLIGIKALKKQIQKFEYKYNEWCVNKHRFAFYSNATTTMWDTWLLEHTFYNHIWLISLD